MRHPRGGATATREPICTGSEDDVLHRRATRCEVVCVASLCNKEHQAATLRDAPRQFWNGHRNTENLPQHTILLCRVCWAALCFDDSVEQSCDTDDMLQRLHRGSDDRLVSDHGDAFADRRHSSDGSRAHGIDEEPTTSRPACHRRLMLSCTRFNCVFL